MPLMSAMKIDFDGLPWVSAGPGARFKSVDRGRKRIRIVEFTHEFLEPEWCQKGHIGLVLKGELEIDFRGERVRYPEGSGIFIEAGPNGAHKARAVTSRVQLFVVEDA